MVRTLFLSSPIAQNLAYGQKPQIGMLICWAILSVRKVASQSKFTEQIFTPQTEQNFQMHAQIILLL